ncbi:hypothetical protein BGM26_17865 [Bacillus sp. FJAT-29790]|uniref:hypothetical protein n=1 Tax=Bacillus sp. FJAT-29790 TaxID=1895002 RepID=UPI001C2226BE|nr:hypothetical protein [Bacillus sp. FJAT-29790]MBU8880822.1 hypothetical protein [Bacillus sp. FJAT-29790]
MNFQKGDISIINGAQFNDFDAVISGSKAVIQSLFTGKRKLRDAVKDEEIIIVSTFRKTLLLESLFLLSKPHDQ